MSIRVQPTNSCYDMNLYSQEFAIVLAECHQAIQRLTFISSHVARLQQIAWTKGFSLERWFLKRWTWVNRGCCQTGTRGFSCTWVAWLFRAGTSVSEKQKVPELIRCALKACEFTLSMVWIIWSFTKTNKNNPFGLISNCFVSSWLIFSHTSVGPFMLLDAIHVITTFIFFQFLTDVQSNSSHCRRISPHRYQVAVFLCWQKMHGEKKRTYKYLLLPLVVFGILTWLMTQTARWLLTGSAPRAELLERCQGDRRSDE